MLEKYSHYFFDLDGVLIDTVDYYARTFRQMAINLGANSVPDYDYFRKNIGLQIEELLCPIVPKNRHPEILPMFCEVNTEFHDVSSFQEVEGATELLKKLKFIGKKIAIITSKTKIGVDLVLNHFAWKDLIDFSVTADDVNIFKPDPEGVLKTIKHFKIFTSNCVFIGDSEHDALAAKNANIDFLGVLTGCSSEKDWEELQVKFISSIKSL